MRWSVSLVPLLADLPDPHDPVALSTEARLLSESLPR